MTNTIISINISFSLLMQFITICLYSLILIINIVFIKIFIIGFIADQKKYITSSKYVIIKNLRSALTHLRGADAMSTVYCTKNLLKVPTQ